MSASDWTDPADVADMSATWAERKAARTEAPRARRRLRARAALSRIPAAWLAAATAEPCRLYLGSQGRRCGRRPTRLYIQGRRCWWHAPHPTPTPTVHDQEEALSA